jgi:hypothetical protein
MYPINKETAAIMRASVNKIPQLSGGSIFFRIKETTAEDMKATIDDTNTDL